MSSLSSFSTVWVQPSASVICSIVIADVVHVTVTVPPLVVCVLRAGPAVVVVVVVVVDGGRDVVDSEVGGGAAGAVVDWSGPMRVVIDVEGATTVVVEPSGSPGAVEGTRGAVFGGATTSTTLVSFVPSDAKMAAPTTRTDAAVIDPMAARRARSRSHHAGAVRGQGRAGFAPCRVRSAQCVAQFVVVLEVAHRSGSDRLSALRKDMRP